MSWESECAPDASTRDLEGAETRLSEARRADWEWRHAREERVCSVRNSVRSVFEVVLAAGGLAGFAVGVTLLATSLGIWAGPWLGLAAQAQHWMHTAEGLAALFSSIVGCLVAVAIAGALVDAGVRELGRRAGIDADELRRPSAGAPEEN